MASAQPHQLTGKYKILEKLHEGGMGAIYKVEHQLLEAVRVIKMIRPQLASDAKFRRRFLEEARGATQLDHPNIAKLHDFSISEDGTTWIVMEYIPGLSLKEIVQGLGPPDLSLTLEIARQTLRALGFLHRKGWVHRDISPDNIMLTEDVDHAPQVKLIDLGIAKKVAGNKDLTSAGYFFAKMRYSSPEHYKESGAEARSDLYSFGLVLYELLTGKTAIIGNDPHLLMRAHLENPPRSFDETDPEGRVPESLRAAVLRALAKDPEDRFATGEDFADAIATLQPTYPLGNLDLPQLFDKIRARQPTSPFSTGQTQVHLDDQFGTETTPATPGSGSFRSWEPGDGSAATLEMRMPSAEELWEQTNQLAKESPTPETTEDRADERTRRIDLSEITIPVRRPESNTSNDAPPAPAPAAEEFTPPLPTAILDPEAAQSLLETAFERPQLEGVEVPATPKPHHLAPPPPPRAKKSESPAAEEVFANPPAGENASTDLPKNPPGPTPDFPAPPVPPTQPPAAPQTPPMPPLLVSSPPVENPRTAATSEKSAAWVPTVKPAIPLEVIEPPPPQATDTSPTGSRYTRMGPVGPSWWVDLCLRFPQLEPLPARLKAFNAGLLDSGQKIYGNLRKSDSPQKTPEQQSWLKAHRLYLVGAGGVIVLVVLLLAFWPRSTTAPPPPPSVVEAAPPPPPPPPPALPEEEIHPELVSAQDCMAAGDQECVDYSLATIDGEGIKLFPQEQKVYDSLRDWLAEFEAAAEAEVDEQVGLIDQLLLALEEGSIQDLRKSYDQIYLLRQEDPSAFSEYREQFVEADKILSENRRMWSSRKNGEHLKVIAHSTRIMEMYPPYKDSAVRYQKEAAKALEAAAVEAEKEGNLGEAKGLLEGLRKAMPRHPGLGEKIANLERQLRADNNIQKTLDQAAQLGEAGKPYEGLNLLQQIVLGADSSYADAHEQLRRKLSEQFRKKDMQGPKIALDGEMPSLKKNTPVRLSFTVTDDYRVADVEAWGRVGDDGSWQRLEVEDSGSRYELVISPEQHDNKRRFDFYLEAVDLSNHRSHYATRDAPQTLRRKRLF